MATDKHATMDYHATVEEAQEVLSLWSVHGLYSRAATGTRVNYELVGS
jgi:hypothetical protein